MKRRQWLLGWMIGLALVIVMAGCGGPGSETEGADATAQAEASPEVAPTFTPAVPDTPVSPDDTPVIGETPTAGGDTQVSVAPAGLNVQVPGGWQQLTGEWAWTPGGAAAATPAVGVMWVELEGPQEPEVALLPLGAQILDSRSVETGIGSGRSFIVEVYGPAPEDGSQAPVVAVEQHVIVVTVQEGRRIAYDFYATAETPEAMNDVALVLDHLAATAAFLAAEAPEPTVVVEAPDVSGEAPQATTDKARAILARHLDISEDAITLVRAEYVEWPDGCLGVNMPDRMCVQVIVPGYRFVFGANSREYEVRTDLEANSVTVVPDFIPN